MVLADITTKVYGLTNATASTYPAANLLIDINLWYERVHTVILRSQDDWDFDDSNKADLPILTTNMVANQQDYLLPSSALRVKRLEVSYDGINFYKAESFDINERSRAATPSLIASDFSQNRPFYDLQGRSLFLYPIPSANSTAGLKLWIQRSITEFTAGDLSTGTASPGFDVLFHQIIAYGAAYEFAMSKQLNSLKSIQQRLQELMAEIELFYAKRDDDTIMSLEPAYKDYGTLNFQTGNIRRIT